MNYNSPNEVAKDLRRIVSNKKIHTQFLKERDKYTAERFKWEEVLCPMCVKLHETDNSKVISDINTWYPNYNSPNEVEKDLMRTVSNKKIYTQFLKKRDKYTAERFKWEEVLCPMC